MDFFEYLEKYPDRERLLNNLESTFGMEETEKILGIAEKSGTIPFIQYVEGAEDEARVTYYKPGQKLPKTWIVEEEK